MKKTYSELSPLFTALRGSLKETICEHMKELGHIKFNPVYDFPFIGMDGQFCSVTVTELMYSEGDAIAYDETEVNVWSISEDGTIDGLMELLYCIEEKLFEIVKD